MKGAFFVMNKAPKNPPREPKPPVVREYDIGGIRYIVTAAVKVGAREDAVAIVRRLIRKDIRENGLNSEIGKLRADIGRNM
jgi:hypothetical protein